MGEPETGNWTGSILLQIGPAGANVRAMKSRQENMNYCLQQVRDQDMDRYYVSLFAPERVRGHLWALLAFNAEVAKIPSLVSEPMLAEIRLQWWRETFDSIESGTPRAHPVAEELSGIPTFSDIRPRLDHILDAWSSYFEGDYDTLAGLEKHARNTGGALSRAMLQAMTENADPAGTQLAENAGMVWSLMGSVRGLPHALVQAGVQTFGAAENEQVTLGTGREGAAAALEPTLERLCLKMETILKEAEGQGRVSRETRILLAQDVLSRLWIRELRKAKFNALKLKEGRPGNIRKLAALFCYHLFG